MRFAYQVLLALLVGVLLAPIVTNIRWAAIPGIITAFSETYGEPVVAAPQPATTDAVDQVRAQLKEEALVAGRRALAEPCSLEARTAYRDSLIRITRQVVADMGCSSLLFCDLDSKARGVFERWYSGDVDREISRQLIAVAERGAITGNDLGMSRFFIGHPKETPAVMDVLSFPKGSGCPVVGGAS